MRFDGNWITVRDVINQLANIEGAVHRDEANDARERALREMAKFYNHSGLPGVVDTRSSEPGQADRTDHGARPEPASRCHHRRCAALNCSNRTGRSRPHPTVTSPLTCANDLQRPPCLSMVKRWSGSSISALQQDLSYAYAGNSPGLEPNKTSPW